MEQIKEIQVDLAEHYPTLTLNPNLYPTLTLTIELLLQKQKLQKNQLKNKKKLIKILTYLQKNRKEDQLTNRLLKFYLFYSFYFT